MSDYKDVMSDYKDDPENGLFRHKCEMDGCENHIVYDDEPYCFKHSPDEGSSVRGYSAYAKFMWPKKLY